MSNPDKLTLDWFSVDGGDPVVMDNPNGWTQGQTQDMYSRISESMNAAWSIKLMALAHHMNSGTHESESTRFEGK